MDTYCISLKLPNGNYRCVDETKSLEEAQIKLLLLEADHPGDYLAFNRASGKPVQGTPWVSYVC